MWNPDKDEKIKPSQKVKDPYLSEERLAIQEEVQTVKYEIPKVARDYLAKLKGEMSKFEP